MGWDCEEFVEAVKVALPHERERGHIDLEPNIWDIVEYGRAAYETRQSRVLRWLLDPHANHGLGDAFVKELALRAGHPLGEEWPGASHRAEARVECPVRWEDLSGAPTTARLDVLYIDEERKTLVGIENKVFSSEHEAGGTQDSQLTAYSGGLARRYADYQRLMIFLAPKGTTTDVEGWANVAHEDLFEVYQDLQEQCVSAAVTIIRDFSNDLQRKLDPGLRARARNFLFAPADSSERLASLTPTGLWGVFIVLGISAAEAASGSGGQYYANWHKELVSSIPEEEWPQRAAQVSENLGPEEGERLRAFSQLMWDHRPALLADHTPSEAVQEIVQKLHDHLRDEPQADAAIGQWSDIRITAGGGQSLRLFLSKTLWVNLQGSARTRSFNRLELMEKKGSKYHVHETGFERTTVEDWGWSPQGIDSAVFSWQAARMVEAAERLRGAASSLAAPPGERPS